MTNTEQWARTVERNSTGADNKSLRPAVVSNCDGEAVIGGLQDVKDWGKLESSMLVYSCDEAGQPAGKAEPLRNNRRLQEELQDAYEELHSWPTTAITDSSDSVTFAIPLDLWRTAAVTVNLRADEAQDGRGALQAGPSRAQDSPRMSKEAFKTASRRPKRAHPRTAPREPQAGPRGPPEGPKTA